MLRRLFDLLGGLVIGLAVATTIHCGTADDGAGGDGLIADAAADTTASGGDGGVPAWAAHMGYGACRVESAGGTLTREFDSEGRMTRIVDSDGSSTNIEYDSKGRLLRVIFTFTDGTTATTDYSFDC